MTADRRGPSGSLAGMGRPKRRAIDVSGLALVQAGALTPGERPPWLVTPPRLESISRLGGLAQTLGRRAPS